MNIHELWAQAVEAFGDDAHKRFFCAYGDASFYPKNNAESELHLDALSVRTIPDLVAHDIEYYGDNAYLMWEKQTIWNDCYRNDERTESVWRDLANNAGLYEDKYSKLKRKKSAALPFDLDRAKAGDVVECFVYRQVWQTAKIIEHDAIPDDAIIKVEFQNGNIAGIYFNDELRMKYPPKLKQPVNK